MITFSQPLTQEDFDEYLLNFILNLEEQRDPKEQVYLDSDSPSNPTIGIGFNLKDGAVRARVFEAFGIDVNSDDATEQSYVRELTAILKKTYSKSDESTLIDDLNDKMVQRREDDDSKRARFEFASLDEVRHAPYGHLL